MNNLEEEKFQYTEVDEEFLDQRLLYHRMSYDHFDKDYEAYDYNVSHMGEKFNVGVHGEEFKKVATKIREK